MADQHPGLVELADWVQAQLPQLIDEVLATIRTEIDVYRTDDVVPRDDLQRSLEHNMRYMVAALGDPDAPRDLAAPAETGRRRAHQGAPLPEVLRAFRFGFTAMWEAVATRARERAQPDMVEALFSTPSLIWQLTDEYAIALTEAYRSTTAELLIVQQRRRVALVEALFTGQPEPDSSPWEIAQLLGMAPDGDLVVVAAETTTVAQESLAGIENELAARRIASAWRLSPALQIGLVSLRPGDHDQLLALLRASATTRIGLSPVYQSLRDTDRALRLARVALARLPTGRAGVHVFRDSPLAALVANDPDESSRAAYRVLGAVLELPADDRATLLNTLHAWFDHGGSVERAADALYCHPNTVRYRQRRVQELTGRSLTAPADIADIATALHALDLTKRTQT